MRTLLIILCLPLLAGCLVSQTAPAYLAKLSGPQGGMCTGFAIDESRLITADHCKDHGFNQAKIDGETVAISLLKSMPYIDTAVYQIDSPILLAQYARFGRSEQGQVGQFFGFCSLAPVARVVVDAGAIAVWPQRPYCDDWQVVWLYGCHGDSGGPVVFDNLVGGMMLATQEYGSVICVVPAAAIAAELN